MPRKYTPEEYAAAFWSRVDRTPGQGPQGECWPWTGAIARATGYGRATGFREQPVENAHRIAWMLTYGPVPTGLCVCHTCDNRACCNPAHLWLGTNAENVADSVAKGRRVQGERSPRTRLTTADVIAIRELWAGGGMTQREIADLYGVRPSGIGMIINRQRWACVP